MKKDRHQKIDYSQITQNIYIGTNMCCQTHFEEKLLKKGIDSDISLEFDRIDAAFGTKFYLWLPTKDHTAPSEEQLLIGVKMINKLVGMGKKVYVHCKTGHGRAPTLVAAYLITQGLSAKESVALLKTKRPTVHLNQKQITALNKFEKAIRSNKLDRCLFL